MKSAEMETTQMEATEINSPAPGGVTEERRVQIPDQLNQQQALQVLVDAARIAQSKGLFTLDDAELVNKAIRAFLPQGPVPSNP